MRGLKLEIQSIPISNWGVSLANKLSKEEWDKIRKEVYRKADYRCEICGNSEGELNCHEVWEFLEKKRIQRLVGFVCLGKLCHDTVHFGRSSQVYKKDYVEKLIKHWMEVNKKTRQDFTRYLEEVKEINRKRAGRRYTVKVGRRVLA